MDKRDYVLIVEDSPTQLAQMQLLLEEAQFRTEIAVNGQLGLDKVRQELPMMVVTDLHMPEMNGLELVEMLKMEFPSLPVLLTTAQGSEEIAIEALRKGAASYVPKRNLEEMLLSTVEQLMTLAEASRKAELLADHLTGVDITMELPNDDSLLPQIIARLQRPVEELKICSEATSFTIATALDEALRNAMIHGNLEVSSDLREIDSGRPYADLIRQRRDESPYRERCVHISLRASREEAIFVIRDEGPGFDPLLIPDPTDPENFDKVSGRGLMLIQAFMDEVNHSANGSEITLIKRPASPDDDDT
ncbi:MAG TPA: response regulator [Pirellulaceae bacterium]|nr:response regulator [Pirellulaceae bacterium]